MKKQRVLITGAAGFIGFHLASHLHGRGDAVVGYDNFNDYYTPQLKRDRAQLLKKEGIEVVEGAICDADQLQQVIATFRPTHVVHLAAQAGVRYSVTHPHAYIEANLAGFLQILEACRANAGLKLVYASSSSVYGLNDKVPFAVTDETNRPASLYGATKKANEVMAHSYHHLYGISMTGLRFFTVYGPWGRPDMAYYSFTQAIEEGRPIEVYNHGKMQRDFTYIDDIVTGISAALDRCDGYHLYNLGNDHPVELSHFIELIEQAIGKRASKIPKPMQPGDVRKTWADISQSRQQLGYDPKTSLEVGIPRFVQWYREHSAVSHSSLQV